MIKSSIATLTLFLFVASSVLAQDPPRPSSPEDMVQHRVSYLTAVLSLSNAQQKQATAIFTNATRDVSAAHDGLRSAHEALSAAVKSNDNAGIEQAASAIGNYIAQLAAANAKGEAAFYEILTADQQDKMTRLEKARGPFFTDIGFGTIHVMEGPGRL